MARFANTIDELPIYAARAEADRNGDVIDTTYQKKLTAGSGITIDHDNVISATGGGGDLPPSTSGDEGKVLTVNSSGDPQWATPSGGGDVTDVTVNGTSVVTNHVAAVIVPTKTSDLNNDSGFITSSDIPSVDEVPAVTSSDDGKVLTASYSGGQGSYSWETAPSAPTYSEGNMIDISAQGVIGVETTAGITDIQMVNALPANPVATVLYLIPAI